MPAFPPVSRLSPQVTRVVELVQHLPPLADIWPEQTAARLKYDISVVQAAFKTLYEKGILLPRDITNLKAAWVVLPLAKPHQKHGEGLLTPFLARVEPQKYIQTYMAFALNMGLLPTTDPSDPETIKMAFPVSAAFYPTERPLDQMDNLGRTTLVEDYQNKGIVVGQDGFYRYKPAYFHNAVELASIAVNTAFDVLMQRDASGAFKYQPGRELDDVFLKETIHKLELALPSEERISEDHWKTLFPELRRVLLPSGSDLRSNLTELMRFYDEVGRLSQAEKPTAEYIYGVLKPMLYGVLSPKRYIDLNSKRFTKNIDLLRTELETLQRYQQTPTGQKGLGLTIAYDPRSLKWQFVYRLYYQEGEQYRFIAIPELGASTSLVPYGFSDRLKFAFGPEISRYFPKQLGPFQVASTFNHAELNPFLDQDLPAIETLGIPLFMNGKLVSATKLPVTVKTATLFTPRSKGLRLLSETTPLPPLVAEIDGKTYDYKGLRQWLLDNPTCIVKGQDGQWVRLEREAVVRIIEALKPSAKPMTLSGLAQIGLTHNVKLAMCAELSDLLTGLRTGSQYQLLNLPNGFKGDHLAFQQKGFSWMDYMTRHGLGVVLADEMGLGKTIEALLLLQQRQNRHQLEKPTLLVVPAGLKQQWGDAIAAFTTGLSVVDYHDVQISPAINQVILVSYDELREHEAMFTTLVDKMGLSGMILDEADEVRNPGALQSKAVTAVRNAMMASPQRQKGAPAPFRVALTGTPVNNHLGDMWALMEFTNPGYMPDEETFKSDYFNPSQGINDPNVAIKLRAEVARERFNRLVSPFILRRSKTDPDLGVTFPLCHPTQALQLPLSAKQKEVIGAILKFYALKRLEISEQTDRRHSLGLQVLNWIRLVCNHPALLLSQQTLLNEHKVKRKLEPLPESLRLLLESVVTEHDIREGSPKLEALLTRVRQDWEKGERTLIYTGSVSTGILIQQYLSTHLSTPIPFVHGNMRPSAIQKITNQYKPEAQSDASPALVLTYGTGGIGLNLQRANHIVMFDRHWNPAKEDQAIARVHRLGQDREVFSAFMEMQGSIEESVVAPTINRKRALSSGVLANTGDDTPKLKEVEAALNEQLRAYGISVPGV